MEGLKAAYRAYKTVKSGYKTVSNAVQAVDDYAFSWLETGLDTVDDIKRGFKQASDYTDSFFRPDMHPQFKPVLPKPELSDEFLGRRAAREM